MRFSAAILVASSLGVIGSEDNMCRELMDYEEVTYVKEKVMVCTSKLEKVCEEQTESHCMDITELDCDLELITNCSTDWTTHEVTKSVPAALTKTLPVCTKEYRTEEHEKPHYECKNVTRQQCTSLWEVVDGEKVWAGNEDDCRETVPAST